MNYKEDKDFFSHWISGLDSKLQAQLNLSLSHYLDHKQFQYQKDLERMKREIIDELTPKISIIVKDAAIKRLNDSFRSFGM